MTGEKPKKFAVFDIDGTLIRWQLYHAVVNELIKQGVIESGVGDKIHQARMTWKRRDHKESFREYEQVLVDSYMNAVSSLPVERFHQAVDAVYQEYRDQVYTYTRNLIEQLKQQNYLLFAISGSHQEIITKLASYYGFTDAVGQQHHQENGHFTKDHTAPMHHKDEVLRDLVSSHGATWTDSLAVGDSESDIAMLELVERPIAFNPTQGLFDHAAEKGWRVVVERKNVTYTLERRGDSYKLTNS